MLKNTQKFGYFATTKDTNIEGKYQMPKGKGKGKRKYKRQKGKGKRKREMPKPKGKRKREIPKSKGKKEKGKGNIQYKGEGKGREIYLFLPNFTGKRNSR